MQIPARSFLFALLAVSSSVSAAEYTFRETSGQYLDILADGKVLARYLTAHDTSTPAKQNETYKPFLQVFDPQGKAPITKGAGGSFPHHRGIFIGWNKIGVGGKTYDRWHMKGGDQVHEKFSAQTAGKDQATFTSVVRWTGDQLDQTLIEEERTFSFLPAPAPGYALIDTVSKLKAVAGETVLDGDPEHSGLHFRPAEQIERTKTTYLYPVANANAHKDRDYPWFGESLTVDGQRYSVVYFNHPGNPTGAAVSAYRDYGRFGAFWKTKIPAGETKEFRARFLIVAGEMPSVELIQKVWNEYAGKNDPLPQTTAKAAELGQSPDSKKKAQAATAPAAPAVTNVVAKPAEPAKAAEPEKPAAEAKPAAEVQPSATPPAIKRAGGGPENPELKFHPPIPKVLTPEEELKTIKVAKGFHVELVATEPMVETPIAVSWDDQARMYVVEMRGYMHDLDAAGEDQPIGRIRRLEDTDGDGVYDKATTFADNLLMPRAVMAIGDGALVSEPPNLTFYHDTDGDGVADKSEVIHDQYASKGGQPEHMANSPTWMMDNWIWSSGHGFRYRYTGGQFIREGTNGFGQWGRTQDDWGRQYFNYNSDFLRTDLVFPGYYARNARLAVRSAINYQTTKDQATWPSVPTPGVNRGYQPQQLREDGTLKTCTATCGAAVYRGDLFPKEYRGNVFIPEPSGQLVKRFVMSEKDGVVAAKNAYDGVEFLTSTDERFRPVNAYTGPDGALYLIDIARGVIQHKAFVTYYLAANAQERKLEQPVTMGRIYRVVPDGSKPKATKLPKETAAIVPYLEHGNGWVRDTAQRVLVERADAAVVPAIKEIVAKGKTPQARLQALWTLEGLNALTPELLKASLEDKDVKVQVAAVRMADPSLTPNLVAAVAKANAELRLQLAFKLSGQVGNEIDQALIALLKKGDGPIVGEAVASGLMGRELEFLELLLKEPVADDQQLVASDILATLTSCVMKERRGSRVARLLDLIAVQSESRQKALFAAAAGKAPAKNAPAPNPIRMDGEPKVFVAYAAKATGDLKKLITRIDPQIVWPGKPGAKPLPVIPPLTPEQQALFDKGKTFYSAVCAACHQPTGTGVANLAPPLLNSEWVLGQPDRPIRIVLNGLTGPIEVAGTKFQLEMPGLGAFGDEDIAAVLTYVRREWDHGASPVSPADVAKVRAQTKGRANAWTAAELKEPIKIEQAKAK